jgi:hypothetical protein
MPLDRVSSRVVDRGGPVSSPPTFADFRPSVAPELRAVVSEDNSGKAPTEEDFSFQGGGDGSQRRAGYWEGLRPSGEHIRGDQDETLSSPRLRVGTHQVDRYTVPRRAGLPRMRWSCVDPSSSLGGSAIAASTHVPSNAASEVRPVQPLLDGPRGLRAARVAG